MKRILLISALACSSWAGSTMLYSQNLEIYQTASAYKGLVCILHGDNDDTVPLWCSRKYLDIYHEPQFHLIAGENHRFSKHTKQDISIVVRFLQASKE